MPIYRSCPSLALGLLVSLTCPIAASAADLYWSGPTGHWDVPANWSGTVPTSDDNAIVDTSGTAIVGGSVVASANVAIFAADSGTGTVLINGGQLTASRLDLGRYAGSAGLLIMNTGMVEANQITRGSGTGAILLNGGTLIFLSWRLEDEVLSFDPPQEDKSKTTPRSPKKFFILNLMCGW